MEESSKAHHCYSPEVMWDTIRATKDDRSGESSYMLVLDEQGQVDGNVAVYFVIRHNKTKAQYGGSQSSNYYGGGYKRKNY